MTSFSSVFRSTSIIPDGFVPSRECVNWLHGQAQKLSELQQTASNKHFKRPVLERVFFRDEWEHIRNLGLFVQLMYNACYEAWDDWFNQPAFDWMKGGDL